jgi:tetratricopeptide (TPR) repeat protein
MMGTIGNVYNSLGLGKEATPLLEGALHIREKTLGPNHLDVAQSLYDLAWCHFGEEGLPLFRRSLEIRERTLGPDHPDVAYCLWGIGACFLVKRDFKDSREALERAQDIFEKKLGPDDIGVAWCLNDIANGLDTQAWFAGLDAAPFYARARPLFERALRIKEKNLGPDHPDVGIGLLNLGLCLVLIRDYEAARPTLERCLAIFEKVLPPDHPLIAGCLGNLGECLHLKHKDMEAKRFLERAVSMNEKQAPGSDDLAGSLNDLGLVLTDLGETARAEVCFQRALAIREKVLAPDDPELAMSLEGYAGFLRKTGRGAKAAPLEVRARAIRAAQRKVAEPGTTREGSGS